jgi:hypothetical protein
MDAGTNISFSLVNDFRSDYPNYFIVYDGALQLTEPDTLLVDTSIQAYSFDIVLPVG